MSYLLSIDYIAMQPQSLPWCLNVAIARNEPRNDIENVVGPDGYDENNPSNYDERTRLDRT